MGLATMLVVALLPCLRRLALCLFSEQLLELIRPRRGRGDTLASQHARMRLVGVRAMRS